MHIGGTGISPLHPLHQLIRREDRTNRRRASASATVSHSAKASDRLVRLFAIIKTTEKLERAYIRDLLLSTSIDSSVPSIERFAEAYKLDCPHALNRLNTVHDPGLSVADRAPNGGRTLAPHLRYLHSLPPCLLRRLRRRTRRRRRLLFPWPDGLPSESDPPPPALVLCRRARRPRGARPRTSDPSGSDHTASTSISDLRLSQPFRSPPLSTSTARSFPLFHTANRQWPWLSIISSPIRPAPPLFLTPRPV